MSKHTLIPAPFRRSRPSVIRAFGPRLIALTAGVTALLLLGGSSYLLSHVQHPTPTAPAPKTLSTHSDPIATNQGQVLGAATTDAAAARPAPVTNASPTASVAPAKFHTSDPEPASFEIKIDKSDITRQLTGSLLVPFTIERHGDLVSPITPGSVTVTQNGAVSNLLSLQSAAMLSPEKGVLVLLPLTLLPQNLSISFTASSGSLVAHTTFSYHLN